jgi:Cu+-exporting ATPase
MSDLAMRRDRPMTDPVCGMDVEPSTAAAAWEHDGTTYYFCSIACFDRFREDPGGVLAADPSDRSMPD